MAVASQVFVEVQCGSADLWHDTSHDWGAPALDPSSAASTSRSSSTLPRSVKPRLQLEDIGCTPMRCYSPQDLHGLWSKNTVGADYVNEHVHHTLGSVVQGPTRTWP